MGRGFMFALDSAVASVALLLCAVFIFSFVSSYVNSYRGSSDYFELGFFTLSLSEGLVKTRNAQNPALGSAYYDAEKRRIIPNVMDFALLSRVSPGFFGKYSLSGLYLRRADAVSYMFNSGNLQNCVSAERFVVIKGIADSKAILGVVVCEG